MVHWGCIPDTNIHVTPLCTVNFKALVFAWVGIRFRCPPPSRGGGNCKPESGSKSIRVPIPSIVCLIVVVFVGHVLLPVLPSQVAMYLWGTQLQRKGVTAVQSSIRPCCPDHQSKSEQNEMQKKGHGLPPGGVLYVFIMYVMSDRAYMACIDGHLCIQSM